ncbi:MAG: tetratricopeptide repeat protein [Planctomycetota bacterium]|jgi:tetratricopeptide (TPR) repeat protein
MFRCIVSIGLIGILSLAAAAQSDPAEDFQGEVVKIRNLIGQSRWSTAKKRLTSLVNKHGDKDYVHAMRVDIEDCMASCVFRENYYEPAEFKSLVSGDLLSYNERTGAIKLRYKAGSVGDFVGREGDAFAKASMVHPAIFCGPYTVEVKGKEYPGLDSPLIPQIVVCAEESTFYGVYFGCKAEGEGRIIRWRKAAIWLWDGEDYEIVEEKDASPATGGKPFSMKVKVGKSDIKGYFNNKPFIDTKKRAGLYGRAGIFQMPPYQEIMITGKIEPAWLQGLKDKELQTARARFEKNYKPEDHLPEWLVAGEAAAAEEEAAIVMIPGYNDPALEALFNEAGVFYKEGKLDEGLEFVQAIDEMDITEDARAYLLSVFYDALERPAEALEQCEIVIEENPEFSQPQLMKAYLLGVLGRTEQAEEDLRRLIKEFPKNSRLFCGLIKLLISDGRFEEARAVVREGMKNRIHCANLDDLCRFLIKVLEGPGWEKIYEHESKHYHIYSDIDVKVCREAAKTMEEAYTAYIVHLERIKDLENKKFPVYLFSGHAGYSGYLQDLKMSGSKDSLGCYVPALQQLMIWNLPDRKTMMRTVLHEGFHQYLHRLTKNPPIWLNEGLAEYYEIAERKGGKWIWGEFNSNHCQTFKNRKRKLTSLKEFLYLGHTKFMEKPTLHYAQSWALIHFLRHTTKENQAIFDRMFEAIRQDLSSKEAVDAAFADVDLISLQREFNAYVESLRKEG